MGKNLKAGTVRLDPQDSTLMRIGPGLAILVGDVDALVANAPIDATVGTQARPVHVMAGIGQVHAEAVHHHLTDVGDTVIVGVLEPPEVGRNRRIHPAVVAEDAGGDAGDFGIEALGKNRHFVGGAVAICVAQLIDALAVHGEIAPVDAAVLVVVPEAAARLALLAGRELALEELALGLDAGQADIVGDPHWMLANV